MCVCVCACVHVHVCVGMCGSNLNTLVCISQCVLWMEGVKGSMSFVPKLLCHPHMRTWESRSLQLSSHSRQLKNELT